MCYEVDKSAVIGVRVSNNRITRSMSRRMNLEYEPSDQSDHDDQQVMTPISSTDEGNQLEIDLRDHQLQSGEHAYTAEDEEDSNDDLQSTLSQINEQRINSLRLDNQVLKSELESMKYAINNIAETLKEFIKKKNASSETGNDECLKKVWTVVQKTETRIQIVNRAM